MQIYDSFDDFLQDKYTDENPMVLYDDLSYSYNNWLADLELEELIEFGEEFGKIRYQNGLAKTSK